MNTNASFAQCRALMTVSLAAVLASTCRSDLYVAGDQNGFIAQFTDSGVFKRNVVTSSSFINTTALSMGYDNALYFARADNNTVYRYDLGTGALKEFITYDSPDSGFHGMYIDSGPGHDIYVQSMGNASAVRRFDGTTGAFKGVVTGTPGLGVGIDGDGSDNLYLAARFGEVYRYDGSMTQLTSGANAEDVKLLPDGMLYVTNFKGTIERYKLDGTPFGALGNTLDPTLATGLSTYETHAPCWTPYGTVYVTNFGIHGVAEIDPWTGSILRTFDVGVVSGVNRPWGMTFGPEAVGKPAFLTPEPASMVALGAAFVALVSRRRNRG